MSNSKSDREVVMAYVQNHDVSNLSQDAVFTSMASGQETRGRDEIGQMLHYFYNIAFQAQAEIRNVLVDGDHAMVEGLVVGRQMLEFAGFAPSDREVRIPICVVYDLANHQITRGRIYLEIDVLRQS